MWQKDMACGKWLKMLRHLHTSAAAAGIQLQSYEVTWIFVSSWSSSTLQSQDCGQFGNVWIQVRAIPSLLQVIQLVLFWKWKGIAVELFGGIIAKHLSAALGKARGDCQGVLQNLFDTFAVLLSACLLLWHNSGKTCTNSEIAWFERFLFALSLIQIRGIRLNMANIPGHNSLPLRNEQPKQLVHAGMAASIDSRLTASCLERQLRVCSMHVRISPRKRRNAKIFARTKWHPTCRLK